MPCDDRSMIVDSYASKSSECSRKTLVSRNGFHREKRRYSRPLECKSNTCDQRLHELFFFEQSVIPTAQRAAIVSGVELAVYDWMKKQLICRLNTSDTIGTHFVCSFVAGFAGALASTPIDVVRVSKRQRYSSPVKSSPSFEDSFNESRKSSSTFECHNNSNALHGCDGLFC